MNTANKNKTNKIVLSNKKYKEGLNQGKVYYIDSRKGLTYHKIDLNHVSMQSKLIACLFFKEFNEARKN